VRQRSEQPRSAGRFLSIDGGAHRCALRPSAAAVGAVRVGLTAGLALVAVVAALLLWVALREPAEGERSSRPALAAPPGSTEAAGPPDPAPGATSRRPVADRGEIAGVVNVPPGVAFPERWELRLSPARFKEPRGTLEKALVFEAGEREFALGEIPFGAYEVQPFAEGMNSFAQPIELSAESPWTYVIALLTPGGTLSGRLLHADGTGIDRIAIRLESRTTGAELRTRTDLSGEFRFESLLDGEYELFYGEPENPVLEPRSISFRAPSMTLPDDYVEGIGQVTLEVVDEAGNPIAGAQLSGSGSRGGVIDVTSDENGMAWVSGLPSGKYRVSGVHPELGRTLRVFDLVGGGHEAVRFVFSP
jgi:hypothetical protein